MSPSRATFAARWHQAVATVPERSFLRFEASDGRTTEWTYAAFDSLVAEVAARLASEGVGTGAGVQVVATNSPAFVATWLATVCLGACMVPSDPRSSARELAEHVERTRPVVAVVGRSSESAFRAATPTHGPTLLCIDEDDCELHGLRRARGGAALSVVEPRAAAAVLFTSGTTSAPKGVVVTQANYAFAGDVMAAAAQLGVEDRQLVVLPLFHANAQYYSFAAAISVGASVALMPTFSASGFVEQAATHGATHASLFAAPIRMILARGATPSPELRLRHCWYAQNISDEQHAALTRLLGCVPRQLYGMTETIPAVLTSRALDVHPSSMGTVTLGCAVELEGPDGGAVADGDAGEIVVRGVRGDSLFAGYLDDARTTERSFRDGAFLTGDMAVRDPEGRFSFAGRAGDVLKVAGENVSVIEVEAVLALHPAVFEAAVVGEPDPVRDEVPVAYVVRSSAYPGVDAAELVDFAAQRLAPAKRPRAVRFVDELPRTSVGKVRKFLLAERAAVGAAGPT